MLLHVSMTTVSVEWNWSSILGLGPSLCALSSPELGLACLSPASDDSVPEHQWETGFGGKLTSW